MRLLLKDIKPNPNNPRLIKDDNFKKLVTSLKDFPEMAEVREIVVNKDHVILGGNMRYRAMLEAGWTEASVKIVDWSEEKQREFIIKDNVSGGEWSWDELANSWDEKLLEEWGLELPVGFGDEEVEEDEAPEVSSEPAISKLGEIYQLGRHRLMAGDSTDKAQVDLLMNGLKADFCFTSPPYSNMRDYGGGDMAVDNVARFLLVDNCDFYAVNLGIQRKDNTINRYWDAYIEMAESRGLKLTAWNIWSKRGMGGSIANMSAMFPIEHEWIFVFGGSKDMMNATKVNKSAGLHTGISNRQKDGTTKKVRPKLVKQYGIMGSVFECVYATGIKEHTAVFPIQLPLEYIKACSNIEDVIYEPFIGSGTTLIACEQLDRTCCGIDIDPRYIDVCRKRYWKFTHDNIEEGWELGTPAIT